jgi:hypothetical protein
VTNPRPHVFQLDGVAIAYLQQRIRFEAAQLRSRALGDAEFAAESSPQYTSIASLPVILRYEQGGVAAALRYFCALESLPVLAFVGAENVTVRECSGTLDVMRHLEVSCGPYRVPASGIRSFFDRLRGSRATEEVGLTRVDCYLVGQKSPETILELRCVSDAVANHLRLHITKLTGSDIAGGGNRPGDRLLRVRIPAADPVGSRFREGVRENLNEIARCLALCGIAIPVGTDVPWGEMLPKGSPYAASATDADADFPFDLAGVVREIREQYEQRSRTVVLPERRGEASPNVGSGARWEHEPS